MSTRSQTEFISVNGIDVDKRTVYRHSDGYPEAMIPDLFNFIRWNQGRMHDPEYTAANWIYWNKRRDEDEYLNSDSAKRAERREHNIVWSGPEVEHDHNSVVKLGYGVCNNDEYHGDIAYLYKVVFTYDNRECPLHIEVYDVIGYGETGKISFTLIGKINVLAGLDAVKVVMGSPEIVEIVKKCYPTLDITTLV